MKYTHSIKKAIKFAIQTHEVDQKQKRKGKDIAYITHPLNVGLILSLAGSHEDVIIAGILHDTIEDSNDANKITPEILADSFGENVARLVGSVTEHNKGLTWDERKEEALQHIEYFSHDSLLVKSADIISNASEMIDDYAIEEDNLFSRFGASKEKILTNQLKLITAIIERWHLNPLRDDLLSIARELQMMGALTFMQMSPAKIIEYSNYDENMNLECTICGWEGTPKKSESINSDSHDCLNVSCPYCDKIILVVSYPLA